MKKLLTIENFILLFLAIQPIFDLVFFYNSISTLIRIVIVFIMFIYTLIKHKDKKSLLIFGIYFVLISAFYLIHNYHALSFKSLVPNNFNYNSFEELLYFIKMTTPFLFIYVVYKNIIENEKLSKVYNWLILFISGSIVVTNIFTFSLTTYNNTPLEYNIFTWFTGIYEKTNYLSLASKGWFYFPNHIIAILVMMMPIFYCFLIKNNKIINKILLVVLLISLLMLGNKISTFGGYAVLFMSFIVYIIVSLIRKETIKKDVCLYTGVILLLMPILIYYSPAFERVVTKEGTVSSVAFKAKETMEINKEEYIKENYVDKRIPYQFIEVAYPYQYDVDFWYNILEEPLEKRVDYRHLELSMLKRVTKINNNELDKWLGIGYSRVMNIFNLEIDFLNQFYTIGVVGLIIFILPYIILAIYLSFKVLNKKNFIVQNILFLSSIMLVFVIAVFSGNLFNSLSVMLPFSFVIGYLLQNIRFEKEIKK